MRRAASPSAGQPIREQEWDFAKCPPEQLYECYSYEYARESAIVREDVQRFRERAKPARTFEELLLFFDACFPLSHEALVRVAPKDPLTSGGEHQGKAGRPKNKHRACIFNFSPEFPEISFLSIPDKERQRRISTVKAVRGGVEMGEWSKLQRIRWRNVFQRGQAYFEEARQRRKLVAFDLDWTLSDACLVESFREWVKRERKRDGTHGREDRGAGGTERQYRSWLKELGAMRLLSVMSWEEAAALSAGPDEKPLYQWQARWITARGTAEKRLENFSKESF